MDYILSQLGGLMEWYKCYFMLSYHKVSGLAKELVKHELPVKEIY